MGQRKTVTKKRTKTTAYEERLNAAFLRAASLDRRRIPKRLKEEDDAFWCSVSAEVRLAATWQITRERYRLMGIDPDTLRMDKTKVRITRNAFIRRRRKKK